MSNATVPPPYFPLNHTHLHVLYSLVFWCCSVLFFLLPSHICSLIIWVLFIPHPCDSLSIPPFISTLYLFNSLPSIPTAPPFSSHSRCPVGGVPLKICTIVINDFDLFAHNTPLPPPPPPFYLLPFFSLSSAFTPFFSAAKCSKCLH